MKAPLSLVPLLPVTIAFGCGIILTKTGVPVWCAGLWLIAGMILALKKMRYFGALAAALALGQIDLFLQLPDENEINRLEGEKIILADVLSVKETETSRILGVKILKAGEDSMTMRKIAPLRSQIVIPSFLPIISAGDRIELKVKMSVPDNMEYFPDQLTYHKILTRQGIMVSGIAPPDDIYSIELSTALSAKFARMRIKVQHLILQSKLDSDTKEFLVTAITGESRLLDSDTREQFAKAGTAHILALSGLHVGIIMSICSVLLLPLMLFPSLRNLRLFLIIGALWLFAFMTGLSPSATRAVIMATCLLLATMLQKRHSSFNALCLAALVILLFDPEALFSISFQLSFAAVTGILLFGRSLNPISERNRKLYLTVTFITMSAGAMLATGVISGYYFHSFPVYFLLANLLIAPILPPLIGCGVAIILLSAVGLSPDWLCKTTDLLYGWVSGVCETIANLPGTSVSHIHLSGTAMTVWIAAIAAFSLWLHTRRRIFATASLICIAGFFITVCAGVEPDATGVYIVPGTYRTDIAICTPQRIDILSTAPYREREWVRESATKSFSEYMTKRNIDTLMVRDNEFSNKFVRYTHPVLTAGNKRMLIVDSRPLITGDMDFDYILVCRGYRNSIAELMDRYRCRKLIFSADLHPKRLSRYISESNGMGIKYVSLRDEAFSNLLSAP